jgi:cobalt-zinc-cadmium efflux system outer membrane protein
MKKNLIPILVLLLLPGCASLRGSDFRNVSSVVEDRTGFEVRQPKKVKDTSRAVNGLLTDDLSVEDAVKISLLHNPDLQAEFQELGIAKADLLQATLIKNPTFEGHARFPNDDDGDVNTEFVFMQDVMDVILMPLRRRVAKAQFEQAKLQLSDSVIALIAEIKAAYYEYQAAQQNIVLQATALQAAEASAELAERLYKAGNINAVELGIQRSALEQAQIDFTENETTSRLAREPLNRLMGLKGDAASQWDIKHGLPELPSSDPQLNKLESLALEQRLDYAAIQKQTVALKRALLATRLGVFGETEVGLNTEKEPDGERLTGPTWKTEVPIFDWKQAATGRSKAELRQTQFKLSAFEVQILSEVREAKERLLSSRKIAERYKNNVIPTRQQLVEDLQKQFNYMLVGAFQLLEAKKESLEAQQNYIEALKDYWTALSNLERAVGGKLPMSKVSKAKAAEVKQEPAPSAQAHHNHGGKKDGN